MSQHIEETVSLHDCHANNGTHGLPSDPSFWTPALHAELAEAFPEVELTPADEEAMYASYLAGVRAREAVHSRAEQNRRDDAATDYKRNHCAQCGRGECRLYANAIDKLCKRCNRAFWRSYGKTEIAQRLKSLA